jgi:hypothetical protein
MATNSNLAQPQILVLNERNYDSRFIIMRKILRSQDIWEFVTIGYREPVDEVVEMALTNVELFLLKEKRNKDNKAPSLIQQGLTKTIFPKVSSAVSSKKSWDILETSYQGVSKVKTAKVQNLRRDFENMKMKDNESVDSFMNQVMNIVNQLRQYGEDLSDKRVIENVLRSLPKKFEYVVVPIEEFKDISLMHIGELTGSLIAHESRMSNMIIH